MMKHNIMIYSKQNGAALITALSILLVLTILGIATVSTTVLQERMAGNARDYEVAFEHAESGLRAAEVFIDSLANITSFNATGGAGNNTYSKDYAGQAWKDASWPSPYPDSSQYMIQEIDTSIVGNTENLEATGYNPGSVNAGGNIKIFQITTRGYGLNQNTRVMLQSYYGKNFP